MITKKSIFLLSLIFAFLFFIFNFTWAGVQEDISDRERQIQELEKQKAEYEKEILQKHAPLE